MIRCVPFEYFNSGRVDHVAFFDTVTDQFIAFDGEEAWESKEEFLTTVKLAGYRESEAHIQRLLALCPMWFLTNKQEVENQWDDVSAVARRLKELTRSARGRKP